ncbi:tripartite tricarboxylate transporter substrate binding protein [Variovorax paradoxus]|nr:tripartite tricarboxylate transporter substrate binding protein [Variovorax paradoxus]MBT2302046.1 tripartite tricarboxylate transporter substrate binding protein [Variovorax paradoxus]
MKRRTAVAVAVALWASFAAAPAALAADTWPTKPITLIVPFPAGGSTDAVARLIALRLGERLGKPVIVDNRAGAGGNLGTDLAAKAAPDGYTLALSTSGPLANNKYLYKSLPFDPVKNLAPVAAIGEIPVMIAVGASAKATTLKEFIDLARTQPGKLSVGNPGNGTLGHLTAELVKAQAKVDMLSVPYKGDTPAMTDVLGGTIDAVSMPLTSLVANVQSGKLKALAVTSTKRSAALPNVPTAIEQGINVESTVWFAVVGPAGMPASTVERLNKEINAILATPEALAKLAQFGATPIGGTAQQLAQLMAADSAKWKKVIETAHIQID